MSSVSKEFPMEKEYEKNPDIYREDIKKLRDWLKTQPHLPEEYITDLDLVLTYFYCEKSSEVSKQVLDLHYTYRTHFDIIFKDRKVDTMVTDCMNTFLMTPLLTPTVNGYKAFYCRLLDGDPKQYVFMHTMRVFMMIFDLFQNEEGTWPGIVLLIDMDLTCMGHLARIDLLFLKHVIYFLTELFLVKLKEVHLLNAPNFIDKLKTMIKPFLKKKVAGIIKVHGRGSETLYQYVPKEAMPMESGGKYKDNLTLRDELICRLKENDIFFKEESRKRVNESLRVSRNQTVEDIFGIQGSFKKLDID